ncbi:MAG: hypothetical protein JW866_05455 [Ignavibacteriales bacterium]|nr:hypothetical protein [Ignavibacteriales bacterium]
MKENKIFKHILYIISSSLFFLAAGILIVRIFFIINKVYEFLVIEKIILGALAGAIVGLIFSIVSFSYLKEKTINKLIWVGFIGAIIIFIITRILFIHSQ